MHTRGVKVYLYSFFNFGSRWGEGLTPRPAALPPRQRAPVSNVEKDGQGPVPKLDGRGEKKISFPHRSKIFLGVK
jgi:hypothetical protein